MPLAGHIRAIAGGFEGFCDGEAIVVEVALIRRGTEVTVHMADAGLVRVEPRKNRGAGRAAAGSVVNLSEAQAVGSEAVDVRCIDFATETADIGKAHIVGKNDDDVGLLCRGSRPQARR